MSSILEELPSHPEPLTDGGVLHSRDRKTPRMARETRVASLFETGCTLVAFLAPLKLAATYAVLIPLIVTWVTLKLRDGSLGSTVTRYRSVLIPLYVFCGAVALSSCFGLNPAHSAIPLLKLIFFTLTIPLFAEHGRLRPIVAALIGAQSIAGAHSILDSAFPGRIPPLFIGKVTESGQLAVTILMAMGYAVFLKRDVGKAANNVGTLTIFALAVLMTVILVSVGFDTQLPYLQKMTPLLLVALLPIIAWTFFKGRPETATAMRSLRMLLVLELPMMIGALLVNLKRGPWFGVAVGAAVFFSMYVPTKKRWILGAFAALALLLPPVQSRLSESYDHFFISGGRSTIWRIGVELSATYPLGIGYHNSEILRRFAPEIPPELRHFHNNALNILAESGWIGLAVFIWMIVAIVRFGFSQPRDPIKASFACAVIAWQVAGLVEYNVGDSEVILIVWLLLGAALGASTFRNDQAVRGSHHTASSNVKRPS